MIICLWLTYSVNGFRPPTSPILLSDSNGGSAIRQLLFAAAAGLGIRRVVTSDALAHVVRARSVDIFIGVMLLGSSVWSERPGLTIKRSIVFCFGLITIVAATHMTRRPVHLMQRIIFGFTASVAWVSIAGWFVLPRNCVENPARPGLAGIAGHPNTLAPFLVLGFLISLGFRSPGMKGIAQKFGQVGLVLGALMTGSMTSIMLMLVGSGCYTYLRFDRYKRGAVNAFAAVIGSYLAVVGPAQAKLQILNAMGRDASLSGRGELWAKVGAEISQRPILGCGYGAFWIEGKGRELVTTWNPRQSHHAYLDVLTDLGIIGLIMVLLVYPLRMFASWERIAGEVGTPQRLAAASIVSVCVGVMGSYGFAQSFYFKMDSFPFFIMSWCILLIANRTPTALSGEYSLPDDCPSLARRPRRSLLIPQATLSSR